jgi:hypothetical protein
MQASAAAIVFVLMAAALILNGCAGAANGAFFVAGEPSGDVDAIASRCISADVMGQTTGTYLMKFPHCAGM